MDSIGAFFSFLATPLYYAISAVLLGWHKLFTLLGLDPAGGMSWALSIVGLTLVIRACLIPLFVKQIKASRNMQLIQPQVKELQKKYGHDRERLAQETMKLYKESNTNPFSACLPMLLQLPIFFTLFRLLDQAAKNNTAHGFLNKDLAHQFGQSKLFGFIPIKETFWDSRVWGPTPATSVMVLAAVLVLAMTATTFTTQRQLMSKNMPAAAMTGQYAQQQKMLLYVLPVAFGLGGVAFPIGVLLYWTTTNLWTMGQQFYVIRNNPAPGTPAFEAKAKRDRAKAQRHGELPPEDGTTALPGTGPATDPGSNDRRPPTRQQPKKQSRSQRKGSQPKKQGPGQRRPDATPPPSPSTGSAAGGSKPSSGGRK